MSIIPKKLSKPDGFDFFWQHAVANEPKAFWQTLCNITYSFDWMNMSAFERTEFMVIQNQRLAWACKYAAEQNLPVDGRVRLAHLSVQVSNNRPVLKMSADYNNVSKNKELLYSPVETLLYNNMGIGLPDDIRPVLTYLRESKDPKAVWLFRMPVDSAETFCAYQDKIDSLFATIPQDKYHGFYLLGHEPSKLCAGGYQHFVYICLSVHQTVAVSFLHGWQNLVNDKRDVFCTKWIHPMLKEMKLHSDRVRTVLK